MTSPTATPPARRDAWPSYAAQAVIGFLLYAVGAIAPYLRADLDLSNAQVGLHSTVMAIGIMTSGVIVAALARRVGEVPVRGGAIAGLVAAAIALGLAPALGVTLAAAFVVGFGTGTLLGYSNAALARPGGHLARLRIARGNVWSMIAGFLCPLALAAVVAAGLPWGLALLPALVFLAAAAVDLRRAPGRTSRGSASTQGRLPRAYWLGWAFVIAAVGMEFSIIFWGSTLVALRTGAEPASATFIGGLFIGGMLAGRFAQSLGLGTRGSIRRPAVAGVLLAILGTAIAWASTIPAVSAGALFLAGAGVAGLYPLAAASAMAVAPGQLALAGTRLTLASGTAIMAAPLALGVVTDAAGVLVGWWLIVGIGVAGLAIAAVLPTGPGEA